MLRGTAGEENGAGVHGAESLGMGRKVRSAEAGRGQRRRQNNGWESLRGYVSINQVSRGTSGKENGVGRAQGGEPGRGVESEECRGAGARGGATATVASCLAQVGKLT